MAFTAQEIARQLDAEVVGDPEAVLTGFAPATTAKPGDLTFAENETFFQKAEQSAAVAILVDGPFRSEKKTVLRVANARIAFAKVLPIFFPEAGFPAGIHPSAAIASTAIVDPSAHIGPHCTVAEGARIGPRTALIASVFVGAGSTVGEDCVFQPNVSLYPKSQIGNRVRIHAGTVVGSDGFGYVLDQGLHRKVPQVGHVVIHDDVEIGANVTIDRGALGPTTIGRGTKIDNLVQIAHNVSIGDHCLIISQVGVAGSTKMGNYVTLAGQVGIAGHLKIGSKSIISAQSGVMHDVPEGEKWFGTPAQPDRRVKRQLIAIQHLPDLIKRVARLEARLADETPRTQESPE